MQITNLEHINKLSQAMILIDDACNTQIDPKVIATWLRVAGDYCYQVAEEILEDKYETRKGD